MVDSISFQIDQSVASPEKERQQGSTQNQSVTSPINQEQPSLVIQIDDPVAAVWLAEDSSVYEWHLGFVNEIHADGTTEIRYFKKASKDSARWNAPEEESAHKTNVNQILLKLDDITFHNGNIIRCSLTKEQLKQIKAKFDNFLLQDI